MKDEKNITSIDMNTYTASIDASSLEVGGILKTPELAVCFFFLVTHLFFGNI